MRLLLVGNYGVGNLGDEALRVYFLSRFSEAEWRIVSASPKMDGDVPRLPLGFRSFFRPWWRTVRAFQSCDGVVFGGGTLFTDSESVRACFLWCLHAKAAYFFGKPLYFAFQGIGPFRTRMGEILARSALKNAAFLSVRDASSKKRADSLVKGVVVVEGFDPVFPLLQDFPVKRSQTAFAIIPRSNAPETFLEEALARAKRTDKQVIILSLQPDDRREIALCKKLLSLIPGSVFRPLREVKDLVREITACSGVFTARYHGAVAALAFDVPFEVFSQGEGDKLTTFPQTHDRLELRALVDSSENALRTCIARQGKRGGNS